MLLLHDEVQTYAWGAVDGLARLVGSAPSGGPEAELWVGTHPAAPSVVVDDPRGRTLAEVIAGDPVRWLGPDLAAAGHTALPFLLKVLAIGSPLSLQAHPSAEQAAAGFAREEAAGIALGDPRRSYRDAQPKPEALVALEPTWALCGFREPSVAAALVSGLPASTFGAAAASLADAGPDGLRTVLAWLLGLEGAEREHVAQAVAHGAGDPDGDPADPLTWVGRLAAAFPGDPTAVAPLLLEVIRLEPGDAVHLPAGNLHAYLGGAGVEVMAASDNVLRGGLTPKHIDSPELLRVLRFEPGLPAGPVAKDLGPGVTAYDAGEEAFALAVVDPGTEPVTIEPVAPSLLLATGGPVDVAGADGGVSVHGGDAVFVAPGGGPLEVTGSGRLWWATTGDGLIT